MPCNSSYMEPTQNERKENQKLFKEFKGLADRLTHACDVIREYLLGNVGATKVMPHVNLDFSGANRELLKREKNLYVRVNTGIINHVQELVIEYNWLSGFVTRQSKMRPVDFNKINRDQIAHRQEDLDRLLKTFAEDNDRERIALVLSADANKPLEPQLGFDPDDF